MGPTKAQIHNVPLNNTTFYSFPQVMVNELEVEAAYKINEQFTISLSATFLIQALKNGKVKQPAADVLLYSNRVATFYRTQDYYMMLNVYYTF